jgi:MFS family permease
MEGLDGIDLGLGSLSLATILIAIVFSIVGWIAFRYGRKNNEPRPLFLGIALMAYGYFVSNAWISLGIGALLTLLIFFPR